MEATTQEITLEEISKRKEALLKEIRQQKELMKALPQSKIRLLTLDG